MHLLLTIARRLQLHTQLSRKMSLAEKIDLGRAYLSGADLDGADLGRANLRGRTSAWPIWRRQISGRLI